GLINFWYNNTFMICKLILYKFYNKIIRMLSPISKESTETIQWTPIDEAALAASSSRPSPVLEEKVRFKNSQEEEIEDCEEESVPSRNWGTTFKVEWIKVFVYLLVYVRAKMIK